ncbi:MAG: hypothetical protein HY296_07990 [Thaumarchaeota archaeon]|nr:hypothetical protein [Nitrososphaerota archaeon]
MIRQILDRGYGRLEWLLNVTAGRLVGTLRSRGGAIQLLYVVGLVALMAGFTSAVDFPVPNQGLVVYPGSGAETIPEAIIDASVIALGAGGIYLTFASGRQTTKSRAVNLYLGAALLLIIFSVLTGMGLQTLKG